MQAALKEQMPRSLVMERDENAKWIEKLFQEVIKGFPNLEKDAVI